MYKEKLKIFVEEKDLNNPNFTHDYNITEYTDGILKNISEIDLEYMILFDNSIFINIYCVALKNIAHVINQNDNIRPFLNYIDKNVYFEEMKKLGKMIKVDDINEINILHIKEAILNIITLSEKRVHHLSRTTSESSNILSITSQIHKSCNYSINSSYLKSHLFETLLFDISEMMIKPRYIHMLKAECNIWIKYLEKFYSKTLDLSFHEFLQDEGVSLIISDIIGLKIKYEKETTRHRKTDITNHIDKLYKFLYNSLRLTSNTKQHKKSRFFFIK